MRVARVDPLHPDARVMAEAGEVLRRGGLVAFPTETVYGLGGNALDEAAVARIFATKGRPSFNPLIVHAASTEEARALAAAWPEAAERLARRFWPGPLTLVLPKAAIIPDSVTAGLPSVALRVPDHPVALALLRAARVPLAAPSANRYTRVSPTTAEHVRSGLTSGVEMVIDGGPTRVGIESTVVDLTGDLPTLLRPGGIGIPALQAVVGEVALREAGEGEAPRPSPGMVRQHYSPRAELRLFTAGERGGMEVLLRRAAAAGRRAGALLLRPLAGVEGLAITMPDDPEGYAARLYAALHELDAAGCALIVADAVPEGADWAGVRDRLARASTSAARERPGG